MLQDDEVTIKRYKKIKDGIALIASNPSYETKLFTFKEAEEHSLKVISKVLFAKNAF